MDCFFFCGKRTKSDEFFDILWYINYIWVYIVLYRKLIIETA